MTSIFIQDIAFDSNGILYGLGDKGSIVPVLFTIDPDTGDAVEIGASRVSNPRLGLGIAFDSDDNLFVATRPGTFWSVDTARIRDVAQIAAIRIHQPNAERQPLVAPGGDEGDGTAVG